MHFLGQVLFNMDEDKQEFVLAGWQRRILIRALAAIEAREPIKGVGTHPLQEGRLERWQQCRKLVGHKAGERAYASHSRQYRDSGGSVFPFSTVVTSVYH